MPRLVSRFELGPNGWCSLTGLQDGGFVVTYGWGPVLGRRYDASGEQVGSEFVVAHANSGGARLSSVAALRNGGFVVTWIQNVVDAWDVRHEVYSSGGAGLPGESPMANEYTPNYQVEQSAAGLVGGGYVLVWQSQWQNNGSTAVYGRLFDGSSNPKGSEFLINRTHEGGANAQVVPLSSGGFVVTWTGGGIYGQRFSASGARVGAEFRVTTASTTSRLAALNDGGYVVAWIDGGGQLKGQRFTAAGRRLGEALVVAENASGATLAALRDGGFVVGWSDGSSVYWRRFNESGTAVGHSYRSPVANPGVTSYSPAITALADGGFLLSWSASGYAPSAYAQRFDAQGRVVTGLYDATVAEGRSFALTLPDVASLAGLGGSATYTVLRTNGAALPSWLTFDSETRTLSGSAPHGAENATLRVRATVDGVAHYDDFVVKTVSPSARADRFFGGMGADRLFGAGGSDTLSGAGGADFIEGGAGDDLLDGGAGDDTLVGGLGSDAASYVGDCAGITVNLGTGEARDGWGNDESITSIENVVGSAFDDQITGNGLANGLRGGGGKDLIVGAGGADFLYGGAGDDDLQGGTANDRLYGDAGDDDLQGGAGNDTLYGGADDDSLTGGAGRDLLLGGDGNDYLDGWEWPDAPNAPDVLRGGAGNDYLSTSSAEDTLDGGSGNDTYSIEGFTPSHANIVDEGGFDTVRGFSLVSISHLPFIEAAVLRSGAGTVTGNAGHNTLTGSEAGNWLIGGGGNDVLWGGGGDDEFWYFERSDLGTRGDRIRDFNAAEGDRLTFRSGAFGGITAGDLSPRLFRASANGAATTSWQRFLFNTSTGVLRFDRDGTGTAAAVTVATLNVRSLTAAQISIFADNLTVVT